MSILEAPSRRRWLLPALIGVIALLIVALGLTLAGAIPSFQSNNQAEIPIGKPVIVSEQQLRTYGAANPTVYWAGPLPDRQYEITRSNTGATYLRYLPKDAKVGTEDQFLTVATYPQDQGYVLLQATAESETATSQQTQSGALVVVDQKSPLSTYFSFPNANFQVEVFSPTTDESKKLVLDGKIGILGESK